MKLGIVFFGAALIGFVAVKFVSADVDNQINAERHSLNANVMSVETSCYIEKLDSGTLSKPFACEQEAAFKKKNPWYKDGETKVGNALEYQFSVPDKAKTYTKRVILDPNKTTKNYKIGDSIAVSVRLDKPIVSNIDYSKI